MGRKYEYCVVFDDCYDIAKRNDGWAVTKDGEFIDNYYYSTKHAAASAIPGHQYKPAN